MTNIVYIATSLDGYIADKEGNIDWLHEIPNPNNIEDGFSAFMEKIDAIVMGRNTFEAVKSFDCEWPYTKPVFVLSSTLTSIPSEYKEKIEWLNGSPSEIIKTLNQRGYQSLYIDGGVTIQKFLAEDLIDEMIITILPILLGGGFRLFGELSNPIKFKFVDTNIILNTMVQNHYKKIDVS